MIKTKVFRMNRSSFIKEMTWLYGMPWIAAATAFVLISVIFSFIYDLRWTVVTLMIIFIIMPMINRLLLHISWSETVVGGKRNPAYSLFLS